MIPKSWFYHSFFLKYYFKRVCFANLGAYQLNLLELESLFFFKHSETKQEKFYFLFLNKKFDLNSAYSNII